MKNRGNQREVKRKSRKQLSPFRNNRCYEANKNRRPFMKLAAERSKALKFPEGNLATERR